METKPILQPKKERGNKREIEEDEKIDEIMRKMNEFNKKWGFYYNEKKVIRHVNK